MRICMYDFKTKLVKIKYNKYTAENYNQFRF